MKKYKVGYTTGVFDLFHIGHLNILRRAKEQCEFLIVGVCTDELVQEYKHKTTIIAYEERVEIVRAIKYVDEVIPQHNRDKIEAAQRLKFDAFFIGDDWKGNELYDLYERELSRFHVDFIYLPYTKKTSSSKLAEALLLLSK